MIITAKFASTCPKCNRAIGIDSKVEWERGAKAAHVTCPAVEAAGTAAPRSPRKPAAPRLPALTGERSDLCAQFEGDKQDRSPQRDVGSLSWLRHRGQRIAVALIGWEPATWLRSEDAEDMGHYGVRSGYYGMMFFRAATATEFDALQMTTPRPDAVRPVETAEVAS